jgi:hypothetical protein
VAPGRTHAQRVADLAPLFAPAERDDGVLLTLARAENDVLVLRSVDPSGHLLAEQRLGVSVSGAYSARWDLVHDQLLIVRAGAGNRVEVDARALRPTGAPQLELELDTIPAQAAAAGGSGRHEGRAPTRPT